MISIIIPTHNRAQLIERSIKSIINQTYTNWELIIVDDGSTDNTTDVINKFLKDSRIKFYSKKNTGAAHTRNIGVEKASGRFITFLDSDDEAKSHWLETMTNIVNGNRNVGVVCCGCEIIDENGNLKETKLPNTNNNLFGEKVVYKMTNGGVFMVKKDIFEKVGGYDNDLTCGQHTELSFRLIPYIKEIGAGIVAIPESLIKIHIHLGDRIRGNPRMKFDGTIRMLKKHAELFRSNNTLKADYEGTVGRNAYLLGKKKESLNYFFISFCTQPSFKRFFRIFKYSVLNLTN